MWAIFMKFCCSFTRDWQRLTTRACSCTRAVPVTGKFFLNYFSAGGTLLSNGSEPTAERRGINTTTIWTSGHAVYAARTSDAHAVV
jgi:hypothetical protein